MLKLSKGYHVTNQQELNEGYETNENQIISNVGSDKIKEVLEHFINIQEEPLFFILELATSLDDEEKIEPGIIKTFHKDVYYIDGCSKEEAKTILMREGEPLINDGNAQFGFASHKTQDEIMVMKYNIVTIRSKDVESYSNFYQEHRIPCVENLKTAWDTFTRDTPGECVRYEVNGKSVYSILDDYKDWGIYFAERREDY